MVDFLKLSSPLEQYLNKSRYEFTRSDILKYVKENSIKFFTFHYTGLDGKLKDLKLPLVDLQDAEKLLAGGERVDGSNLFRGLVDASGSDLYVVPVFSSAFLNPFIENSLDFMCRYFDKFGNIADFTPDNALQKAYSELKKETGIELYALGELEFYLIGPADTDLYPSSRQTGYHQSAPFTKMGGALTEMLEEIAKITGRVKYAHSEVGVIEKVRSFLPELSGKRAEQFEIEFLPKPIDEMADDLIIGKWLIRNIAYKRGLLATFTPKIEEGIAGNGLHFHFELRKSNKNIMVNENGLSDEAMKLIGGIVHHGRSLSAFGNTVASSYLRLVPNQEAPTRICWSDLNRSTLIRVPLGWQGLENLASKINPQDKTFYESYEGRQTVELRSPDGSAFIHALLAGVCLAVRSGLKSKNSIEIAKKAYMSGNAFSEESNMVNMDKLPSSCVEGASTLEECREFYEEGNTFQSGLLDFYIELLKSENDKEMNMMLGDLPADDRLNETRKIMHKDLHEN